MTTLDDYPILKTVRDADRPDLNWMHKPGEQVRYYKRIATIKDAPWQARWLEVSAGEAYDIARRKP